MHYGDYKTIISPQNGMNLYRGCTHGCIYCDSRSHCYQIDHDFEDIEIKRNAVQILDSQLKKKRKKVMIGTGAMCDPYIPLEKDLGLTRQCISLIKKHGHGLSILTKSNLILRDLDLLDAINRSTKCVVQMTMTTYDETLCKQIEPNVSTTYERYKVLKVMQEHKIPTVIWLSPTLPFINDTEENLQGIMDYCIDAGVIGIMNFGFGVTMREGNREYFYEKLDKLFPGMKQRYKLAFKNSYVCNSFKNRKLMKIFKTKCQEHNIMYDPDEIFNYLRTFESKEEQLSFL